MASHPHPRVAGFAFAGDPERPVVCVCVQQGDEPGVWIGRSWPGAETEVIGPAVQLRRVTLDEAARDLLETWPQTTGRTGNALQEAAIRGRRELIEGSMQASLRAAGETQWQESASGDG